MTINFTNCFSMTLFYHSSNFPKSVYQFWEGVTFSSVKLFCSPLDYWQNSIMSMLSKTSPILSTIDNVPGVKQKFPWAVKYIQKIHLLSSHRKSLQSLIYWVFNFSPSVTPKYFIILFLIQYMLEEVANKRGEWEQPTFRLFGCNSK